MLFLLTFILGGWFLISDFVGGVGVGCMVLNLGELGGVAGALEVLVIAFGVGGFF